MVKELKYFMVAFIIIGSSTPLGRIAVKIVYYNTNLASEYFTILNGFIYSFMLIGILIFIVGLADKITNNKTKL